MKNKEFLKDILFKLCTFTTDERETLLIIFNVSETTVQSKNLFGTVDAVETCTAQVLNISKSLDHDGLIIEDLIINDAKKAREMFEIFEDVSDFEDILRDMVEIISREIVNITKEMNGLQKCLNAVGFLGRNSFKIKGEDNFGKEVCFANFNIKNIFNDNVLNPNEMDKLAPVFLKTIIENKDIDVDNNDEVMGLKNKIELAIIDALPHTYELGDIDINVEQIKSIVRQVRDHLDDDDDEEEID